jgi:hypothetical protein
MARFLPGIRGMTNDTKGPRWWETGGSLERAWYTLLWLALLGGLLYIPIHFIVK